MRTRPPYARRSIPLIALLFGGPALAWVDADSDGYDPTGTPADCNDSLAVVNPGANEHPNETDDDCDGSLGIRRDFVDDFESGADWTISSGSISPGELVLTPIFGTDATATMNYTLPWQAGRFTVHVDIDTFDGATCRIEVSETGSATVYSQPLSIGTTHRAFTSVAPGDTIDLLRIRCQGVAGNDPRIDWLTVSNGESRIAPLTDVETDAMTMSFPSGGRMTFVRSFGSVLYTGSDVGGFAYSLDGANWTPENGRFSDFTDPGEMGVWDAWHTGDDDLFVLTGGTTNGELGGIWQMDALDGEFEELDLSPYEIGFSKHFDECPTKSISSGKLIVSDANYADDNFYVLSQDEGDRGIFHISDASTSPAACKPYDPAWLPDGAVPRAAAIVGDPLGTEYLVVGYGPRYLSTSATDPGPGLYACPLYDPADPCPAETLICEPIDDGDLDTDEEAMDVRDIEVDPNDPDLFYVADGGVRLGLNEEDVVVCAAGHSTISAVRLADDTIPDWQVWDTDNQTTVNVPTWADDASTGGYEGYADFDNNDSGCPTGASDAVGELVGWSAGQPIVSVTASPDSDYLFAFYGVGNRVHACVTAFRTDLPSVLEDTATLPWQPLMNYGDWDDGRNATGSADRRDNMNGNGAWFGDTDGDGDNESPLIESFAQMVHDAQFWLPVGGQDRLQIAASWHWWIPTDGMLVDHDNNPGTATVAAVGWNAPYADLDELYFEHGWNPVHTYQDNGSQAMAVHIGTNTHADIVYRAVGDLAMSIGYGAESATSRPTTNRPCQIDGIGAGGYAVSTWQNFGGGEVWYGLREQGTGEHDSTNGRTLLFHDGTDWCWDGADGTGYAQRFDTDHWEMVCADEEVLRPDLVPWTACNNTATVEDDAFGMDDIGNIIEIEAIGSGVALITAWGVCDSTYDSSESCPASSGEGLWVATRTKTGTVYGMTYEKVWFDASAGTSCSEARMFEGTDGLHAIVGMAVAPDTDVASGTVHAYVMSSECGVFEVTFDLADPTSSTTTDWTLIWDEGDTTDCVDNDFQQAASGVNGSLEGIELSIDGEDLLVYGGEQAATYNGGGICVFDVSGGGAAAAGTTVVSKTDVTMLLADVSAHPWIEDMYAFGGYQNGNCTTCAAPGAYLLEKRQDVSTSPATETWSYEMVSSDDLEARHLYELAWGRGAAGGGIPVIDHLYISSGGQGPWDLKLTW